MPLPEVTALQMAFSGGVDESTRAELLEPGASWVTLENIRQDKRGGATKRLGFSSWTLGRIDGTSRAAGYRLFAHGQSACIIDGHHLDAYSPTATSNVTRDRVPEAHVTRQTIPWPQRTPDYLDVYAVNGYVIAVALVPNDAGTSYELVATVIDAASGTVMRDLESIVSGLPTVNALKLSAVGSTAIVVYKTAANTLSGRTISLSSAANINTGWSSATALCTDATINNISVDTQELDDRFALAYMNNGGGTTRVSVRTFNAALVQQEATTITTAAANPTTITVAGSISDTLWVAWSEPTDVKVIGLDADVLASVLATSATVLTAGGSADEAGIVVTGSGAGRLFVTDRSSSILYANNWTTAGGAVTTSILTIAQYRGMMLLARPFRQDSRTQVIITPFASEATTQDVVCVVDATDAATQTALRPVANLIPRLNRTPRLSALGVPHTATIAATRIATLAVVLRSSVGTGLELVTLDYGHAQRWLPAASGRHTYLSGGVPTLYDGQNVTEINFIKRPETPTTATGGTGITATNLRYVAIYEWVDASGAVHWSGTSDPSAAVSPADDTVTVTLSTLTITSKQDAANKIRIAIYRSDNGAAYRRLATVENITSSHTTTYADATASVASNAKLYSQPGTLGTAQSRSCPPSLAHMTEYNGMMVGADGTNLWYSGQFVDGEGVWFSDIFQMPVPGDGDITGLAVQDGTLYVFKRRAIYTVAGEAPSDNGSVGGLTPPRRLAVDVGTTNARSLCVTELGILFLSERGIELLTRAQSVDHIGERVQDTLDSYPIVTAATLDSAAGLVYIELAASETLGVAGGSGRTLVFDLTLRNWVSVDRRTAYNGTADTPAQSGAVIYDGSAYRYAWLETNGMVHPEGTTHLDVGSDSTWITQAAVSPKLRVAGIQGNHRLISAVVLAERHTNHQLRINVAYDDSSTWTDSETWTAVETAAINREQCEIGCSREQVMSVQVRVEDLTPSNATATPITTGKGATWVGLAINIGPNNTRQTTTLLPAANRK
jgi:hypothetical protein